MIAAGGGLVSLCELVTTLVFVWKMITNRRNMRDSHPIPLWLSQFVFLPSIIQLFWERLLGSIYSSIYLSVYLSMLGRGWEGGCDEDCNC